jgi:hypothetical protein
MYVLRWGDLSYSLNTNPVEYFRQTNSLLHSLEGRIGLDKLAKPNEHIEGFRVAHLKPHVRGTRADQKPLIRSVWCGFRWMSPTPLGLRKRNSWPISGFPGAVLALLTLIQSVE